MQYVEERDILDRVLNKGSRMSIYGNVQLLNRLRKSLHACRQADRKLRDPGDPEYGKSIYDKLYIRNPVPHEDGYVLHIDIGNDYSSLRFE